MVVGIRVEGLGLRVVDGECVVTRAVVLAERVVDGECVVARVVLGLSTEGRERTGGRARDESNAIEDIKKLPAYIM